MKNIYFNGAVLMYYGNPAGYMLEGKVILDPLFEKEELLGFLKENGQAGMEIREGVYDRLVNGGIFTEKEINGGGRRVRIYQLKPDSPIMMRFISLAERKKRGFGEPHREDYVQVYDGEAEKFDLEEIWDRFGKGADAEMDGHALSISDVVEFTSSGSGRYFYVEPSGYQEIIF